MTQWQSDSMSLCSCLHCTEATWRHPAVRWWHSDRSTVLRNLALADRTGFSRSSVSTLQPDRFRVLRQQACCVRTCRASGLT